MFACGEVLREIRAILAEPITDTERVTRIAALLAAPREPDPDHYSSRGWIIFDRRAAIDLLEEEPCSQYD